MQAVNSPSANKPSPSQSLRNVLSLFNWSLLLVNRTLVIKKTHHKKRSRQQPRSSTMRASTHPAVGTPTSTPQPTTPTTTALATTSMPASWEDLANTVIASELVYKSVDVGHDAAERLLRDYASSTFSTDTVTITDLAWSPPSASQRYMLASSDTTLYVAFMGTKQPRDFVTNALCWQEAFLEDAFAAALGKLPGSASPTVHSGFRKRAASVPIMDLWKQARDVGKRLVLTGHSLGGSVAQVCTLSLLRSVPEARHNNLLRCVCYATPAIGNAALKSAVEASGWDRIVTNISLPEDVVPHLLSWTPQQQTSKTTAASSSSSTTTTSQRRMMTAFFSLLLPSLLPQASVAASLGAGPLRAASWAGWLCSYGRVLPLAGAVALPFFLPPGLLWGAGLFGCYAAIACLKSSIRLGPQHFYMIGRQFSLTHDGALVRNTAVGKEPNDIGLWLHGCPGAGSLSSTPSSSRGGGLVPGPRSLLGRVSWQYAMHRMPPLRTRLQAAQAAHSMEDVAALLCG